MTLAFVALSMLDPNSIVNAVSPQGRNRMVLFSEVIGV
jgi:hypothetical protein